MDSEGLRQLLRRFEIYEMIYIESKNSCMGEKPGSCMFKGFQNISLNIWEVVLGGGQWWGNMILNRTPNSSYNIT
jgi:hypothetical protein